MGASLVQAKAKDGKERGVMSRKFQVGAWLLVAVTLGVAADYGRC
ncbi:MAG TPA: hypothetical protein VJ739_01740 [Gemmataceae bacterium]|nr:hypothetical protein [Gemmataceae bacterium]